MGVSDFLIASGLIGFSCYIIYHSFWKKKGNCHGCSCSGGSCSSKPAEGGKLH